MGSLTWHRGPADSLAVRALSLGHDALLVGAVGGVLAVALAGLADRPAPVAVEGLPMLAAVAAVATLTLLRVLPVTVGHPTGSGAAATRPALAGGHPVLRLLLTVPSGVVFWWLLSTAPVGVGLYVAVAGTCLLAGHLLWTEGELDTDTATLTVRGRPVDLSAVSNVRRIDLGSLAALVVSTRRERWTGTFPLVVVLPSDLATTVSETATAAGYVDAGGRDDLLRYVLYVGGFLWFAIGGQAVYLATRDQTGTLRSAVFTGGLFWLFGLAFWWLAGREG
jgi:hypothetical protein